MKKNNHYFKKGEIITLLTIAAVVGISLSTIVTSLFLKSKNKIVLKSQARESCESPCGKCDSDGNDACPGENIPIDNQAQPENTQPENTNTSQDYNQYDQGRHEEQSAPQPTSENNVSPQNNFENTYTQEPAYQEVPFNPQPTETPQPQTQFPWDNNWDWSKVNPISWFIDRFATTPTPTPQTPSPIQNETPTPALTNSQPKTELKINDQQNIPDSLVFPDKTTYLFTDQEKEKADEVLNSAKRSGKAQYLTMIERNDSYDRLADPIKHPVENSIPADAVYTKDQLKGLNITIYGNNNLDLDIGRIAFENGGPLNVYKKAYIAGEKPQLDVVLCDGPLVNVYYCGKNNPTIPMDKLSLLNAYPQFQSPTDTDIQNFKNFFINKEYEKYELNDAPPYPTYRQAYLEYMTDYLKSNTDDAKIIDAYYQFKYEGSVGDFFQNAGPKYNAIFQKNTVFIAAKSDDIEQNLIYATPNGNWNNYSLNQTSTIAANRSTLDPSNPIDIPLTKTPLNSDIDLSNKYPTGGGRAVGQILNHELAHYGEFMNSLPALIPLPTPEDISRVLVLNSEAHIYSVNGKTFNSLQDAQAYSNEMSKEVQKQRDEYNQNLKELELNDPRYAQKKPNYSEYFTDLSSLITMQNEINCLNQSNYSDKNCHYFWITNKKYGYIIH